MSTSVKGATTVLRVQGPGSRFLGPWPRIQAVLAVLECRYLGQEILN